jgi:hypothetical protein
MNGAVITNARNTPLTLPTSGAESAILGVSAGILTGQGFVLERLSAPFMERIWRNSTMTYRPGNMFNAAGPTNTFWKDLTCETTECDGIGRYVWFSLDRRVQDVACLECYWRITQKRVP